MRRITHKEHASSPRGTSSLAEKMRNAILTKYIDNRLQNRTAAENHQAQEAAASAASSRWSDVQKAALSIAGKKTVPHSEGELRAAVHALTRQFPTLPSDAPMPHPAAPKLNIKHIFDKTPQEALTPRGASMFPPLQKLTPRTSSRHTNLRTHTAEELVENEKRLAYRKPVHPPYYAHHFGKANSHSARRKRNVKEIETVEAACGLLHSGAFDDSCYGAGGSSRGSGGVAVQRQLRELTKTQIDSVIHSRSRFGLHFTAPPEAENEAKLQQEEGGPQMLLSDEMMDRLKEKQRQLRQRQALDRATSARQLELERLKEEYRRERSEERERGDQMAAEVKVSKEQVQQRRAEQRAMAEELHRAERLRQQRFEEAQAAKERYAEYAREQNILEQQHEEAMASARRRRREATSRVNMEMASQRRTNAIEARSREKELERSLLAAALE